MAEMRLDKFLSDRTEYTRSEIRNFLKNGAVRLGLETVRDGSRKLNPDEQEVFLNQKKIHGGLHLYLVLNKPENYLCATEDKVHKTVLELVPKELKRKNLFPAGRLDLDSTGFVLLTDDGTLSHQMLSPKNHVPKYYLVKLARPFEDSYPSVLRAGLVLSDGTVCLPAEVQQVSEKYCIICLHEGKYHQVKRMFAFLGNHVEHLHRVAVGSLLLPPDLPSGACLEIFHKEIQQLLKTENFPMMFEQIVSAFSSYWINEGR